MDADHSGLEVLSRDECLRLLSGARTGRVGFHADALPVVLPVAFAVDYLGIVVRVRAGSQIDYATRDAVVAFAVLPLIAMITQWFRRHVRESYRIVRGLIAILFSLYSGKPAREILATDAIALFDRIGLRDNLTPQRSNGLHAMVERIRAEARAALAPAA